MISLKNNAFQNQLNQLSSLIKMFERSQCLLCSKKKQQIQNLNEQVNSISSCIFYLEAQRAKLKKEIFQLKLIISQYQNQSPRKLKSVDNREHQLKQYKQFQNYHTQTDRESFSKNIQNYSKNTQIQLQTQKIKLQTTQKSRSFQIQSILNISPESNVSKQSDRHNASNKSEKQSKKQKLLQSRSQKDYKSKLQNQNHQIQQLGQIKEFQVQYLQQEHNLKLMSFLIQNNAKLSLLVERVNYLIKLRQISRVDESQQWKSIQQVKEILKNQIKRQNIKI